MSDYSGTAVTVLEEKGYGDGVWRNVCPIGCPWHGSEWPLRADAVLFLGEEKGQHKCLRAPHLPALRCLDEAEVLLRQARDCTDLGARARLVELADRFMRIAAISQGLPGPEVRADD